MEFSAPLAFAAIVFTLIAMPGPTGRYVLAAGAREHVPPSAASCSATRSPRRGRRRRRSARHTVPFALLALTAASSCYLTYLGVRVLKSDPTIKQRAHDLERLCQRPSYGLASPYRSSNPHRHVA